MYFHMYYLINCKESEEHQLKAKEKGYLACNAWLVKLQALVINYKFVTDSD